jgi:hypothetical protein
MPGVSIQLLVLLDPNDSHSLYEIDVQIFTRCNSSQACRDHIGKQVDENKYLFLPDFETELAKHAVPGVSDTIIHVYCNGQQSHDSIKEELKARALNKIFTVDELPYYLYQAGIELLYKLMRKPPKELNERERHELVLISKQLLTKLDTLFEQYRIDKLGQDVVDLR